MQFDPMMPERLGAEYVDESSQRRHPVMLHRAIVGSMERFIGILIEHYAGTLPFWLSPVQAVVATIVSDADAYAMEVVNRLKAAGIRAESDLRNEKINYKVREHSLQKVPLLVVVGRKEAEQRSVSLRRLGQEHQRTLGLEEALIELTALAAPPIPLA
jgi:threonyl-tRNA synthetase